MRYSANLKVGWSEIKILPRGRRLTFKSILLAERALERKARHYEINSRGIITDTGGKIVLTIAL